MAKNLISTYTKDFFLMGKNAKQGGFATFLEVVGTSTWDNFI